MTAPVEHPRYDRAALRVGIVHFGVGGFHRAHQAAILDDLMNAGLAHDWAVCGVGVLPGDVAMRDALRSRDCRYTLVLKHPDGTQEAREIGSIIDYRYAPDDPDGVIEQLADPAVRIVSLTVTEGGYCLNPTSGEFDASDPAVAHDLAPGAVPRSAFGLIVAGLVRRRERGIAPFTVMSCDNIPGNGEVARRMMAAFAARLSPELGAWLAASVAFPNSMVDRITPAITAEDRAHVESTFGVTDAWPVVAEPFLQWVIEDEFPSGRPPYERAGVQLVADVRPYELMKLRLLNSSHQGLCYFGHLLGYRYAHEAAQDPLIVDLLTRYMHEEAMPTLSPVVGIDLVEYQKTLIERFANPHVRDTIARLCADSSDRIPTWLLPVVRAQLERGGPVRRSAAIVASWARYAEGVDERGAPIEVVDRRRDGVMAVAARQRESPLAFLRQRELFGDLADSQRFVADYRWALDSLIRDGARATLSALAAS
ncbi:mannitol dehydrogenase family protein [Rugosimonospora africana]|uniref:Mannitol-1-phosphate 5-dehydrogenase n=1 Tax=Rugosimonospora africana TaxID=556532 RepID=A0A8J3QYZ2_9ACTN|nr:mannitol dehydrogenase family protein [Rugosimonospora africana]GIH19473.1 mannitol 2-dehydrogenase [Rugosimonospora africana]